MCAHMCEGSSCAWVQTGLPCIAHVGCALHKSWFWLKSSLTAKLCARGQGCICQGQEALFLSCTKMPSRLGGQLAVLRGGALGPSLATGEPGLHLEVSSMS